MIDRGKLTRRFACTAERLSQLDDYGKIRYRRPSRGCKTGRSLVGGSIAAAIAALVNEKLAP